MRENEHKQDVKTLEEKKYTQVKMKDSVSGSAPLGHIGPWCEGEPHHQLGGCKVLHKEHQLNCQWCEGGSRDQENQPEPTP